MMTRTRFTTLGVGIALGAMAMTLTPSDSLAQPARLPAQAANRFVVDGNAERGGPEAVVFDGTKLWVVLQFGNQVVQVVKLPKP